MKAFKVFNPDWTSKHGDTVYEVGKSYMTIIRELTWEEVLKICNTDHRNTGDWNTGFFNTDTPTIRMFNKDTGKTIEEINIPDFLCFDLTVWVSHDTATDEEKKQHKQEIKFYGGFLKELSYKEAFQKAWNKASKEEHEQVKQLPNFDADIFYEISGIRV